MGPSTFCGAKPPKVIVRLNKLFPPSRLAGAARPARTRLLLPCGDPLVHKGAIQMNSVDGKLEVRFQIREDDAM